MKLINILKKIKILPIRFKVENIKRYDDDRVITFTFHMGSIEVEGEYWKDDNFIYISYGSLHSNYMWDYLIKNKIEFDQNAGSGVMNIPIKYFSGLPTFLNEIKVVQKLNVKQSDIFISTDSSHTKIIFYKVLNLDKDKRMSGVFEKDNFIVDINGSAYTDETIQQELIQKGIPIGVIHDYEYYIPKQFVNIIK